MLAAQLATTWHSPCAILRSGSTNSALAADPKNVLASLGLQLRARFGPEIFGPPLAEIRGVVAADRVVADATVTAVHVGAVRVSPFRRILVCSAGDPAADRASRSRIFAVSHSHGRWATIGTEAECMV